MNERVPLKEMYRRFAEYVRAVERGESLVITRRGKPAARLLPIQSGRRALTPEQQAARERALERMRRGIRLGGASFDREELYDERCGVSRHDA